MNDPSCLSVVCVVIILICTGTAGALSVTLHPTDLEPGEKIFIEIRDFPDGREFELLAEGIYPPGENLTFQLTEFEIPFTLTDGEIVVNVINAGHAAFCVKKGDTIATMEAYPPDGIFSRREARNISSGNYAYLRLDATPFSLDQPVKSVIHLRGMKQGTEDATLSFSIGGVQAGQVRIIILVDGIEYLNELMTIGEWAGSMEPGLVSPDGIAWLAGTSDSSARLLVMKPAGIPEGWEAVTRSYSIVSSSTDLGNDTLLTIMMPETIDPDRDTFFIARAKHDSWEMLPSRIRKENGINVITAPVREPGEYCLMAFEEPETTVPPTKAYLSVVVSLISLFTAGLVVKRRM